MRIGQVELKNNLVFAPIAGYSDAAMRYLARKYGAGLTYTEMVSVKGLYYGGNTKFLLEKLDDETPSAVQLFGSDPEVFRKVVKFEEVQKFDIIDINMGCPVRKIVSNGDGSALMDNPTLVSEIVAAAKESKKAVTVKFRIGHLTDSVLDCAVMAQKGGADAVTVHGRRQIEFYSGVADHSYAREVKKAVQIPVIVNGDINSKESYTKALAESGADGAMVARAAVGRPFIFSEILDLPFSKNVKNDVLTQIEIAKNFYPQNVLVGVMKKHLLAYAKTAELPKKTNLVFTSLTDFDDMMKAVDEYFV